MRSIILFSLVLLFIGCESAPPMDYVKELKTSLEDYNANDRVKLDAHVVLVGKYKKMAEGEPLAPVEHPREISLNFDPKGNAVQLMAQKWDIYSIGTAKHYFRDEVNLEYLVNAVAQPADSFRPTLGDNVRYYDFVELDSLVDDQMNELEYVVVLKQLERKDPVWIGAESFEPGSFRGQILIYAIDKEELVASIKFKAVSSVAITLGNYETNDEAGAVDLMEQVDFEFLLALKENCTVKGDPCSIKSSPGFD